MKEDGETFEIDDSSAFPSKRRKLIGQIACEGRSLCAWEHMGGAARYRPLAVARETTVKEESAASSYELHPQDCKSLDASGNPKRPGQTASPNPNHPLAGRPPCTSTLQKDVPSTQDDCCPLQDLPRTAEDASQGRQPNKSNRQCYQKQPHLSRKRKTQSERREH